MIGLRLFAPRLQHQDGELCGYGLLHLWFLWARAACTVLMLIGAMSYAWAGFPQGQFFNRDRSFVRIDRFQWGEPLQLKDDASLMVVGCIGRVCVINATYDIEGNRPIIAPSLLNFIWRDRNTAPPSGKAEFFGEPLFGKDRPASRNFGSSYLLPILSTEIIGRLVARSDQPCIWHDIESRCISDIHDFKFNCCCHAVFVENKVESNASLGYFKPRSLSGGQCPRCYVSSVLGGLRSDASSLIGAEEKGYLGSRNDGQHGSEYAQDESVKGDRIVPRSVPNYRKALPPGFGDLVLIGVFIGAGGAVLYVLGLWYWMNYRDNAAADGKAHQGRK